MKIEENEKHLGKRNNKIFQLSQAYLNASNRGIQLIQTLKFPAEEFIFFSIFFDIIK